MKKNIKVAKDEVFNVRCTAKQKALLEATASAEGLGLSTWVLQAALVAAQERQTRKQAVR